MKEVVSTNGKRIGELPAGELHESTEGVQEARCEAASADSLPLPSQPTLLQEVLDSGRDAVKRPARILVVDDIDTNREIVEAYLTCAGYSVDAVGSAAEAIDILESESRDLVLMDIQMPVMDGIAATRFIRSLSIPIKDVPIIAMTANVFPEQVRSYLKAGMNGHVGKPIEPAKLYDSIQRCLSEAKRDEISMTPTWLQTTILGNIASTSATAG